MKHIGLIGGLSPESTIEYYKIICTEFNRRLGGLNFPKVTIRSVNLQEMLDLFKGNQWDKVADRMVAGITDLRNAGADFAAITANTPHNAYDKIKKRSSFEVLSIMDATAREITKAAVSKVALLGTKPTMEFGFFQRTFEKYGIQTMIPEDDERNFLDRLIWEKLSHGKIEETDRKQAKEMMQKLVNRGAQGVILGCTELPLLIREEDASVQLFDTMKIHAHAILNFAFGER